MSPQDLIEQARVVLDDTVTDPALWSDDELVRYLNEAINEACQRALLIEDRSTAACCTINLVAGQAEYPLHKSIIRVKRAAWGTTILEPTSTEEQDDELFGWEIREGRPAAFIETGSGTLRLSRIPRDEDVAVTPTLSLVVYRTLLAPLTPDSALDIELADIKPIYQLRLLDWVGRMAYLKRDSEVFDQAQSNQFEADFTRSFGPRPTANQQRKRRDRRPPIVRVRF